MPPQAEGPEPGQPATRRRPGPARWPCWRLTTMTGSSCSRSSPPGLKPPARRSARGLSACQGTVAAPRAMSGDLLAEWSSSPAPGEGHVGALLKAHLVVSSPASHRRPAHEEHDQEEGHHQGDQEPPHHRLLSSGRRGGRPPGTVSPESDPPFVSQRSVAVCTRRHTPLITAHPRGPRGRPSAPADLRSGGCVASTSMKTCTLRRCRASRWLPL